MLHFNNNEEHIPWGQPNHDKLFKLRPILEHFLCCFETVCVTLCVIPCMRLYHTYKDYKQAYRREIRKG